ncbi:hypothetical protein JCM6882_001413 [Rhodosporidiobolus microsporus]
MSVQAAAGYAPRAGTQGTEHMMDGQTSFNQIDRLAEEESLVGTAPGPTADSFEMTNRMKSMYNKGKQREEDLEEINLGSSMRRFESQIAA